METKPTYKTAEELGIERWEHDGLVALVGPLSRGELVLDMAVADDCGSAHCIGGWIAALSGKCALSYVGFALSAQRHGQAKGTHSISLYNLFFPEDGSALCDVGGWLATAPQAAHAIVNFLVTGDPQWKAVMAEPSQP